MKQAENRPELGFFSRTEPKQEGRVIVPAKGWAISCQVGEDDMSASVSRIISSGARSVTVTETDDTELPLKLVNRHEQQSRQQRRKALQVHDHKF